MSDIRVRLQARLAELHCERARVDAVIAELTGLLGAEAERQPSGNPPAPAPSENGKPGPRGKAADRVRDLLAEAGPLRMGEIVERTQISQPTLTVAMRNPWFRKQSENRLSPWELTDEGRAALDGSPH